MSTSIPQFCGIIAVKHQIPYIYEKIHSTIYENTGPGDFIHAFIFVYV
jgi:hypothetical protein